MADSNNNRISRNIIGLIGHPNFKHGHKRKIGETPEWRAWINAKDRCFNPNSPAYHNYGSRGIAVCEGWRNNFASFFEIIGPSNGLELDRKDNDGHYSCGQCHQCLENGWTMNCRWVTRKAQSNNRRTNRFLTCRGETHTMQEWSDSTGIKKTTLRWRIDHGWPIEKALAI